MIDADERTNRRKRKRELEKKLEEASNYSINIKMFSNLIRVLKQENERDGTTQDRKDEIKEMINKLETKRADSKQTKDLIRFSTIRDNVNEFLKINNDTYLAEIGKEVASSIVGGKLMPILKAKIKARKDKEKKSS